MLYLTAFVISMVLVLVLIPPFRKLAIKIDFVDKPRPDSERKIHREPIPLTAGIAIFIGFFITYFALTGTISREAVGIFIGSVLILGIGLVDDWYKSQGKELASLPKLIVQISAAVIVYSYGIQFEGFNNPFTGHYINLPEWLQLILTIFWIFGVTTVINFSDGIDGLAGGLSAISGGTLFVVAMTMGQSESALLAVILVGAALGYLRYNKPPARVFMGDAGATFLGFILGIIALDGAFKGATLASLFIPIFALGVPIIDNVIVVIRRMLQSKPIYQADASQAHYRLLATGLNQKQTLVFLCLLNLCFGLTAIILALNEAGA
ncbi:MULTISPECIES: MraY family glycosyltransferase [Paenibacillus]|uniref:Undecaprenyl-phosphate alpha-N-acetylglucosaminyl 1-phosphate transferase n=3 Tax=Bacilli TaxID=91061 RepID=A0A1B2E2T1_9BACL|nr:MULTISPECIES: MraY family glycosyltransferase [Paenibacillus]ANY74296.1 undecaprenyl-phosphate alpha-N-acetylglucosaminyl 1-phosphate transferase [Paenibacillus ihbetae]MBP1896137.1 UDP-N-acetylmuramyl pentapeptide phosphotransferase/UDP-N-acetylglucosamine-1-phosphate transferase [Paenibacillus lactis]MCM3496606.1 undecaprenyl/decaprenyl-phosphate alpha-N-acetylglucosaminyl 1-phosphate transferase [Paenibacillus lactis]OOC63523.1 undecaprenyl-phosphate alpha-N-acetylglucosaminyl 1-phosphate